MYIYIKGFRSIHEYESEFSSQSITLLSGPSGIGKSTLMNAIFWCLYGTIKNVRKFGTKSGCCMVVLKMNHVKITRSKSPESLIVEMNDLVFKDTEAQEKIVNLFGSSHVWLTCCYLRQGTRNKFIESAPSERLDILSELCFSSSSPEKDLEKIDEKNNQLSKEFERMNDFYKRDLESFQKKRKQYPKYKEDILSQEQKKEWNDFIQGSVLSEIETRLLNAERMESSYRSLVETRNEWVAKFPNYSEYLFSEEEKEKMILTMGESEDSPGSILLQIEEEIKILEKKKVLCQSYQEQFERELNLFSCGATYFVDTKFSCGAPDKVPVRGGATKFSCGAQPEPESVVDINRDSFQEYILSEDRIKELNQQLLLYPKQIEKEEIKWNQAQTQKISYQHLLDQYYILDHQYLKLRSPEVLNELFEQLCQRISSLEDLIEQKKKLENKRTYLYTIQDILSNPEIEAQDVDPEDMKTSFVQEKKITERKEFLKSISVHDHKNDIEKAVQVRRKICEIQPLLARIDDLQKIEEMIQNYEDKLMVIGKGSWISEKDLPKKILEFSTAKNSMNCPKCSISLRFENNHLTECKVQIPKDKLDDMEKLILNSKQRIEWLHEKERLENELNEKAQMFEKSCQDIGLTQDEVYTYPKLEEMEIQKLIHEYLQLEKYIPTYDQPFISPDVLEMRKKKWDGIKIQEECKDLESMDVVIENVDFKELDHQRNELLEERTKQKMIFDSMNDIKQKIDNHQIDECWTKEDIQKLKERLESIKNLIEQHEKAKKLFELSKKIEELCGVPINPSSNLSTTLSGVTQLDKEIEEKKRILSERWKEIEEKRRIWNETKQKWNLCERADRISELDRKISSLVYEDPLKVIHEKEETKKKIEDIKLRLYQSEKAEELLREREVLEKQRENVITISHRVGIISKLKMMANELEHKRMVSILEVINDFSNEILSFLFDEPIKIDFMIYKTSKNARNGDKEKTKPSIVYKLLYKGHEIDHVDQLSGGEGDRVSLAVTCAFFQFSKFPFLLLDEFASSLDLNTKEMAIKSLKTFLGIGLNENKSILCISQDSVVGIYDHTIPLKSL